MHLGLNFNLYFYDPNIFFFEGFEFTVLSFSWLTVSAIPSPNPPATYAEQIIVPTQTGRVYDQKELKEILFGVMLSDGHLSKRQYTPNNNAQLRFAQSATIVANREYFKHVFMIFFPYISQGNVRFYHRYDKVYKKYYHSYHFSTVSSPFFTEFFEMVYVKKVKVVPLDLSLFTPLALAQFLMGDGSFRIDRTSKKNKIIPLRGSVILCTDCFTLEENNRIKNHLEMLGLKCSIQTNHKTSATRVNILTGSIPLLIELVQPHMIPSMLYKLGLALPQPKVVTPTSSFKGLS